MSEYVFRDADYFGCDMNELMDGGHETVGEFLARENTDHYGTLHEEVVRCKDCKYALMSISGEYAKYCKKLTTLDELEYPESEPQFDADFFCGYGERKEDE